MKQKVTQAIVLSRLNYGEADRILTILSADYGRLSLIAKGARRLKSRLAGGIEPLCINEITYTPGKKELGTLISARMLTAYTSIVQDYDRSQIAFQLLAWLKDHLEDDVDSQYFAVTAGMLQLLASSQPPELARCYFLARMHRLSGQALDPFLLASGQKLPAADSYSFNFDTSCFRADPNGNFTQADIKLLRLLLAASPEVLLRTNNIGSNLDKLKDLLTKHQLLSMA